MCVAVTFTFTVFVEFQGLLRLVDVPGHERLRMKFFDQYKETTRALIFVIDTMTFQKDLRDVAEYVSCIHSAYVCVKL